MSQLLQFYKSFQQARAPATKSAPTFEDLTIDDKLTEKQRVVRYTKSTIGLQRLVHTKMLAEVAQTIGFFDTIHTIIPLLEPLSRDVEAVVKQHLVEQLKTLAKFCAEEGGEEGYRVVRDKLLPITAALLEDDKQEVRQSASMTLVEIAHLIRPDDLGQYVLTIVLRLAHEDDKEEMRMTAAQLLNLLAECLGHDLCRQFVIPEVVSLAEDPVFRVRKSTALNFHLVCKIGGEHELLERLMPAFVRLSKDDMYRVRRACAESLSEISKNVGEDIRLGVLVEIFLRLTHDPSKLVKQTILQQSGTFIATLPPRAVSETILNQYISMANNPTGDATTDSELRHICAYTFPAVLHVITKNRWREVRELYHSLAQTRSTNIRQTLAYSLHEIARMLEDEQVVEEELAPIFEEYVQDTEVVQLGIMKHLSAFLRKLPELCRVSYLPVLHDFLHSTNPFNWRLRQYLALQLPQLIALPSKPAVYNSLLPTIMILLQDPVASVRRETFPGVSAFMLSIYEVAHDDGKTYSASEISLAKKHLEEFVLGVNQYVTSDKSYLRQLWMELARQLLKDLPIAFFEKMFLPGVLKLTLDRVLNVRLAVAMFLSGWGPEYVAPWEEEDIFAMPPEDQSENSTQSAAAAAVAVSANGEQRRKTSPWTWLLRRQDIKNCVYRLSKDDRDVYLHVSQLRVLYPDIEFRAISCRGMKIPPGGNVPIEIDASEIPEVDPTLRESALLDHGREQQERLRSSSNASLRVRSSSVEGLAEEAMGRPGLPVFSSDHDEDELMHERAARAHSVGSSGADELELEHEYLPTMIDPEAIQELDIIDGILKSPPPQTQVSAVPRAFLGGDRRGGGDDDDDIDEEEELRRKLQASESSEDGAQGPSTESTQEEEG